MCISYLKIQHAYVENIWLTCIVYSQTVAFVPCKLIGILYYVWFWHSVPELSESSSHVYLNVRCNLIKKTNYIPLKALL
jgi:hypothetical protein